MTPSAPALRRQLDDSDEQPPRVQLASVEEIDQRQAPEDRRAHRRRREDELHWIRNSRLSAGHGVTIVDLSPGGALVDSPVPLRPDSLLTLEIAGRGFDQKVQFRVVRCQIGALLPERTVYRGACSFITPLELPAEQAEGARILYPGAFAGLDLALKEIVERRAPDGSLGSLDSESVQHELDALRARALRTPLDPIANPLAGLLSPVIPALEHYKGLSGIVARIETELRQTIPAISLRLTDTPEPPTGALKSILINVPGAAFSSALVSVDLPRGVVLNAWQSRVLRVAVRLVALLQRIEPDPSDGTVQTAAEMPAAPSVNPVEVTSDRVSASGWQKIVVRYAEGQILKGFTQDFSPNRSQFSLWPSLDAAPRDRVIVPLARLKGVFFVRDFAGNPGYIERTDSDHPQHGRRIEVTLVDDEVIGGRTLSYRPDGYGFFVIPADPLANNQRVFIVSSAVRQVRFP